MIIKNSFTIRFFSMLLVLFVLVTTASAKGDKALVKEKIRRQSLHKAWLTQKMDNDAYYLAVDAPTISGCQQMILRSKKMMQLYKTKLSKVKTPRAKKKYIGALKAYKVYGETMVEVVKAFKAKESGKISTELYPIIRKCERRIMLYTGRSVNRNFFFTPEVYPEYFKSKEEKAEDSKKSDKKKVSKSVKSKGK